MKYECRLKAKGGNAILTILTVLVIISVIGSIINKTIRISAKEDLPWMIAFHLIVLALISALGFLYRFLIFPTNPAAWAIWVYWIGGVSLSLFIGFSIIIILVFHEDVFSQYGIFRGILLIFITLALLLGLSSVYVLCIFPTNPPAWAIWVYWIGGVSLSLFIPFSIITFIVYENFFSKYGALKGILLILLAVALLLGLSSVCVLYIFPTNPAAWAIWVYWIGGVSLSLFISIAVITTILVYQNFFFEDGIFRGILLIFITLALLLGLSSVYVCYLFPTNPPAWAIWVYWIGGVSLSLFISSIAGFLMHEY